LNIDFAKLWLQHNPHTQFICIGVSLISTKADLFKKQLGNNLINLVNKTTPLEAFAISDLSFHQAYWCIWGAAIAAIFGHMFPVWLGFRGGKGVATGVGVFLILAPGAVAFAGLIFILIVLVTRYVSLGSIIAAVTIPLFILVRNLISPSLEFAPEITAATVGALLIIFAHRANIRRLMHGNESKFS